MALTFRDIKGSPLTAAEVDENFRTLDTAIDGFVSVPGVGVSSISIAGTQFFVHLTDATTQGPFPLPVATFQWRGDWVGGTTYEGYDVFSVPNDGVYLVLAEYVAATEFDPTVSDTSGPLLSKMFGEVPIPKIPVVHVTGASHTADISEAGSYFRMENGSGAIFHVPSGDWVEGDVMTIRRVAGEVSIEGDTDVSVVPPSDCSPILRTMGSTATLIFAGSGVWDLSGDLALTTTTTGT